MYKVQGPSILLGREYLDTMSKELQPIPKETVTKLKELFKRQKPEKTEWGLSGGVRHSDVVFGYKESNKTIMDIDLGAYDTPCLTIGNVRLEFTDIGELKEIAKEGMPELYDSLCKLEEHSLYNSSPSYY